MKVLNDGIIDINAEFVKILDNGKRLFKLNGKYMTFYEDIPGMFTIADRNADEFRFSTQDENKEEYADNFLIWPEIGEIKESKFDPDLFKC